MISNKNMLFIYYKLFKPGGVARVLVSLANELVEAGHDITILVLMDNKESFYPLDPRVKIITLDSFSHWTFRKINVNIDKYFKKIPARTSIKNYMYDFGQWDMLSRWLDKNHQDYDIIISSWYKLSSQLAIKKNLNYKTIAWEHANYEVGGQLWKNTLRRYYKNLKAIVCLNQAAFQHYKTINPNSYLIPNLIGQPFESFERDKITEKSNTLLFVGRLDDDKNVQELLEILTKVNMRNFVFKIIGDGPSRHKLELQLSDYPQLKEKVKFLGEKNLHDIFNELSTSKIFLFTSKTECLPTVLIEANLTGNALIAYNCKYGPSDIVNSNNGYLVDMHNQKQFAENLQQLIDHPQQLHLLNIKSFENSTKWHKSRIMMSWHKVFT